MESSLTNGRGQRSAHEDMFHEALPSHMHKSRQQQQQQQPQLHFDQHMQYQKKNFNQKHHEQQQQQQQQHQRHFQTINHHPHYYVDHYRRQSENYHENDTSGNHSSTSSGCEDDISTNGEEDDSLLAYAPANTKFNSCDNKPSIENIRKQIELTSMQQFSTIQQQQQPPPSHKQHLPQSQVIKNQNVSPSTHLSTTPRRRITNTNGIIETHEEITINNDCNRMNGIGSGNYNRRRISSLDRSKISRAKRENQICGENNCRGYDNIVVHQYNSKPVDVYTSAEIEVHKNESSRNGRSTTLQQNGNKSMKNGNKGKTQTLRQVQHFRSRSSDVDSDRDAQIKSKHCDLITTAKPFECGSSNSRNMEHVYQKIAESSQLMRDTSSDSSSRMPTPSSIRALLMVANRNNVSRLPTSKRHLRFGTQENIYEEITSEERLRLLSGGHSMMSLHRTSTFEEEYRRVQNRHRRILGQLNLSVEAMLMPSSSFSNSPTEENADSHIGENDDAQGECSNSNNVRPTDELLSPTSAHQNHINGDIDSGFSGSSSSGNASCLGSLRYRNDLYIRPSTPNSQSSSRSFHRSNEDPGILMVSPHNPTIYNHRSISTLNKNSKLRFAIDQDPIDGCRDDATAKKSNFWNRKCWRKFSGFTNNSNTNNKSSVNNGKFDSIFSCDV